jgi:ATP-dependent Clp protease ATP-binding subunit ClpB
LKNETDVFSRERKTNVEDTLAKKRQKASELQEVWQAGRHLERYDLLVFLTCISSSYFTERARLEEIKDINKKLESARYQLEVAQREGSFEVASRLRFSTIPELESKLPKEGSMDGGDGGADTSTLLHDRDTSSDIARVVARATGIPVQSLLKGEKEKLVHVRSGQFY